MSIQFRSRIKTAIDSNDALFTGSGVCCNIDGSKHDSLITYSACMEVSGYWQYAENIEDIECPPLSSKGCCCSCSGVENHTDYMNSIDSQSYVPSYLGGLEAKTKCECNDIGGLWSPEQCIEFTGANEPVFSVYNLCTHGAYVAPGVPPTEVLSAWDVRYPGGCCVDDGQGGVNCEYACDVDACQELQGCVCIPEDGDECPQNCSGFFNHTTTCNDPVDDPSNWPDCSSEEARTAMAQGGSGIPSKYDNLLISNPNTNPDQDFMKRYNQTLRKTGLGIVAACVENINRNKYTCKLSSIEFCNGYFMGMQEGGSPYNCNDTSEIDMIKTFLRDGTVTEDVVKTWKEGEYRIAGRYIGIYSGISSNNVVYGHPKTGSVSSTHVIENEDKNFKSFTKNRYAVIVPENDYASNIRLHNSSVTNLKLHKRKNSTIDSISNMNIPLDVFKHIKNSFSVNGIGAGFNWVVPSKTLLAFMMLKTQRRNVGESWSEEFNINAYDSVDVNNLRPVRGSVGAFSPMLGSYWSSTIVNGTKATKPLMYTHKRLRNESSNARMMGDRNPDIVSACELSMSKRIRLALLVKIG